MSSYDLHIPCSNCPFRSDKKFHGLSPWRIREIALQDGEFACHKTTEPDADGMDLEATEKSKVCAGFLIFRERSDLGPNQMMRIAERLGLYDHRKLSDKVPVYESLSEMIEAIGCDRAKTTIAARKKAGRK